VVVNVDDHVIVDDHGQVNVGRSKSNRPVKV
jgi:hypothetical protein